MTTMDPGEGPGFWIELASFVPMPESPQAEEDVEAIGISSPERAMSDAIGLPIFGTWVVSSATPVGPGGVDNNLRYQVTHVETGASYTGGFYDDLCIMPSEPDVLAPEAPMANDVAGPEIDYTQGWFNICVRIRRAPPAMGRYRVRVVLGAIASNPVDFELRPTRPGRQSR